MSRNRPINWAVAPYIVLCMIRRKVCSFGLSYSDAQANGNLNPYPSRFLRLRKTQVGSKWSDWVPKKGYNWSRRPKLTPTVPRAILKLWNLPRGSTNHLKHGSPEDTSAQMFAQNSLDYSIGDLKPHHMALLLYLDLKARLARIL